MTEEIYLGFDPGGKKHVEKSVLRGFGWAICSLTGDVLHVLKTGLVDNAKEAITETLKNIPSDERVLGAGIDAPLFWTESGERKVDERIRCAIKERGAPSPGGTVQSINSLRGACLVQGVLVAYLLRNNFPEIAITESHPKALLYLLGADLSKYVDCGHYKEYISNHEDERDAILGAITAFAREKKRQGWENLMEKKEEEEKPIFPLAYSAEYWMPLVSPPARR